MKEEQLNSSFWHSFLPSYAKKIPLTCDGRAGAGQGGIRKPLIGVGEGVTPTGCMYGHVKKVS